MDLRRHQIAHAELDFGNGRLQLSDPNPEAWGLVAGPTVARRVSEPFDLACTATTSTHVVARAEENKAP